MARLHRVCNNVLCDCELRLVARSNEHVGVQSMTHIIVNSGMTRREAEEWSFDWAALNVRAIVQHDLIPRIIRDERDYFERTG